MIENIIWALEQHHHSITPNLILHLIDLKKMYWYHSFSFPYIVCYFVDPVSVSDVKFSLVMIFLFCNEILFGFQGKKHNLVPNININSDDIKENFQLRLSSGFSSHVFKKCWQDLWFIHLWGWDSFPRVLYTPIHWHHGTAALPWWQWRLTFNF